MDQPWLIIGDFNQVLLPTTKSNANGSTSKMHNIYVCMDRNQFIKVPQKGPSFTSMNNRKGKALIIEKLDMVLILRSKLRQCIPPKKTIRKIQKIDNIFH